MVVNVNTGAVAQRMEYDEFGNMLVDTAPGFQPFGFAGGIYDSETGLVRYGARDYDALIGRWTAKDPASFGGGQANLYGYVGNDPINAVDDTGLGVAEVLAYLREAYGHAKCGSKGMDDDRSTDERAFQYLQALRDLEPFDQDLANADHFVYSHHVFADVYGDSPLMRALWTPLTAAWGAWKVLKGADARRADGDSEPTWEQYHWGVNGASDEDRLRALGLDPSSLSGAGCGCP